MSTTTFEETIEVFRSLFTHRGLPEQLVSDNGLQFTSTNHEMNLKVSYNDGTTT